MRRYLSVLLAIRLGLTFMHPAVTQAERLGVVGENPRRVAAHDLQHGVDHLLALGAVVHVLHALEQAVEFRIVVVGGVLAAGADLLVRAVQQEQEVFRIGVVGVPAPLEQLRVALADLVLEAVVVGAAHHQLHVELVELLLHPVEPRLGVGAARHGVEIQHQRLAGLRVAAVRVARLGQQLFGAASIGRRWIWPSRASYT
jgi:hypothetical protein